MIAQASERSHVSYARQRYSAGQTRFFECLDSGHAVLAIGQYAPRRARQRPAPATWPVPAGSVAAAVTRHPQGLIRMDRDTASALTGRAALTQRAGRASSLRENVLLHLAQMACLPDADIESRGVPNPAERLSWESACHYAPATPCSTLVSPADVGVQVDFCHAVPPGCWCMRLSNSRQWLSGSWMVKSY